MSLKLIVPVKPLAVGKSRLGDAVSIEPGA